MVTHVLPPPRRRPLAALLAISLATAPFAQALAGPAEDKATARELAKEGIAAEGNGDCPTAIDKLERAESLFHAPPHLQYLARCYTKVGRLVDATETWRKLTLESLPPNAPQAFKDAMVEAQTELPKLEPRLARLTVKTASKYDGLQVEIDGKPWPSAALDVPRVIDPGTHLLRAKATGFKAQEQSVVLAEGKSDTVTFTLEPGGEVSPVPSASASASAAPTSTVTRKTGLGTYQVVGLIATGTGVLAMVGGAFTGISANSKFRQLDQDCPVRTSCKTSDLEQRKSTIRTLETATNVLLIGGGILVAAGLTLTILAPSGKAEGPAVALTVVPLSSGGHVALSGSF